MVRGAHEQYGLDYTIIRPFNAVGKGEVNRPDEPGFSHVIPDFITKIKNKRVLEVFGDGNQIRSFTHAKDIADGVLMCLENKAALNNDFNFVTEEPITMLNLARKLWGMLRKDDFVYNTKATNFIHDVKKRQGTYEKAERVLGWKPKFNLDDTLKEMVEFYG
jgi:nucleoside-diphosphate-sugar epimerase